jgi:hypothetical protein
VRSETRCPGCGARLRSAARVCGWCGRPQNGRGYRQGVRLLWAIVAVVCVLAALAVVALVLVNPNRTVAQRPTPTAQPSPSPGSEAAAEEPAETAATEPTAEPAEYVRVVNTAGQGIILRAEPSVSAPRVAARVENTVLRVVGPDQSVDGRTWRHVEDAQGQRGWAPAEFLAPAPAPG